MVRKNCNSIWILGADPDSTWTPLCLDWLKNMSCDLIPLEFLKLKVRDNNSKKQKSENIKNGTAPSIWRQCKWRPVWKWTRCGVSTSLALSISVWSRSDTDTVDSVLWLQGDSVPFFIQLHPSDPTHTDTQTHTEFSIGDLSVILNYYTVSSP